MEKNQLSRDGVLRAALGKIAAHHEGSVESFPAVEHGVEAKAVEDMKASEVAHGLAFAR